MALLVESSMWWRSTLTSGVFHPFSLVLPCFSTHAQLLSLICFLLFPFSLRRTRRKGRKGMWEFQEGSGRLVAVSTNDALPSSWDRGVWGSSRHLTKRYLSGLRGQLSQHSSVPCYSRPPALQLYQQAAWLCCVCHLYLSPHCLC